MNVAVLQRVAEPRPRVSSTGAAVTLRGVTKAGALTVTTHFTGAFREDASEQVRFMTMLRGAQR